MGASGRTGRLAHAALAQALNARPGDVDGDLRKVFAELEAMPEHVEDWTPDAAGIDALDAYASEWAAVAYDRMDALERAYRSGGMSAEQERRYGEVKTLFRERLPLIRRYELDEPRVPLGGRTGR